MIYLLFNEGYSASGGTAHMRVGLCEEAIRLARLLLRLFPSEPEVMGLMALLLLQHARVKARLDRDNEIVLLEDQDRQLWNRQLIDEALVLVEKALRHRRPGPYQVQAAIAAVHSRAPRAADTDWQEIDTLYGVLEQLQPSPVVTLNRAVAVSKLRGPAAALEMIEPLGEKLQGYFHFFGARGAWLHEHGLCGQRERSQRGELSFLGAPSLCRRIPSQPHPDRRLALRFPDHAAPWRRQCVPAYRPGFLARANLL